MWALWACLLLVLCDRTNSWISDADCVTPEGISGRCTDPGQCPPSYSHTRLSLCRYSRGYSTQICCPRSPVGSQYSYTLSNEREGYNSNEPSISFPSESTLTEFHPYNQQPTSNSYNPFVFEGPDYTPYNPRPSYNERPSYTPGNSNYNPFRPGPSYNENPGYSDHRPYRPSHQRPSYTTESTYDFGERPKPTYGYNQDSRPSVINQGRPDSVRPRPSSPWGGSDEGVSSWEYQPNRRTTTLRPIWSVDSVTSPSPFSTRKSISQRKCEEYSRPVSETIDVLPLSLDAEAVPLKIQKCDFSAIKLIVGGEASELGEFPHMAALGFQSYNSREISWNCGGTLISERFVMTAGHCVNTTFGSPVVVRLGEYNLLRDNDGANPVDYPVQRIIIHPNYFKSLKYNDIALIQLSRPVRFSKFVRPACLPSDNIIKGQPIATGWGRTDFVGKLSDILMKVSLKVIDTQQCNKFYSPSNPGASSFSSGIIDTMLCAGELSGGRDTCLGDSGGPLTITKNDNPCIHYVVGITSFGKICGAPNSPGVYTRVYKYLTWIERTVWSGNT